MRDKQWIDTGLDPPDEIVEWQKAPLVQGRSYRIASRSVAVLYADIETNNDNRVKSGQIGV
jgi:hypothetical protein